VTEVQNRLVEVCRRIRSEMNRRIDLMESGYMRTYEDRGEGRTETTAEEIKATKVAVDDLTAVIQQHEARAGSTTP
jgi:hypothetical protein